jgi:hypothetical protein
MTDKTMIILQIQKVIHLVIQKKSFSLHPSLYPQSFPHLGELL